MRKIITMAVLLATLSIAACNTVSGAGKDVKSVGSAVDDDPARDDTGHLVAQLERLDRPDAPWPSRANGAIWGGSCHRCPGCMVTMRPDVRPYAAARGVSRSAPE